MTENLREKAIAALPTQRLRFYEIDGNSYLEQNSETLETPPRKPGRLIAQRQHLQTPHQRLSLHKPLFTIHSPMLDAGKQLINIYGCGGPATRRFHSIYKGFI